MRTSPFALPVLALALLLAACGTPDTDVGAAPSADDEVELPADGDEPVTSPDLPTADDDAAGGTRQALPPARDVHADAENLRERSFESGLYDETDDSFHVVYAAGREPCYALGEVQVVEDADTVTVTLLEGNLPADGEEQACPDDAQQASVEVDLEAPLDGRELLDGSTGQGVPVDVITSADAAAS